MTNRSPKNSCHSDYFRNRNISQLDLPPSLSIQLEDIFHQVNKKKIQMIPSDCDQKVTRMRILERERKKRIFNDKQRLIGVDKGALDEQVRERKHMEEILRRDDEILQRNLIKSSLKAIEEEQIQKYSVYRNAEYQRQLQNMLLAKEQQFKNRKVNQETLLNIPTDDYYNYFNTSSR